MADPWVAPGSQPPAAGDQVPTPFVATADRSAGRPIGADLPPLPLPLRPSTIPDLLDGALRAWKLAPATIAGMAAVFVVPLQILVGVVTRDEVDDVQLGQTFTDAFTATGPGDVDTGFGSDVFLLNVAVQGVVLAFVTAGVATLVSGWYLGRHATAGTLVRAATRRAWPLLAAWVLVHLVEVSFGVFLFVPALLPLAWFAVVSPVVACEGAGPLRAMRRSASLCGRRLVPVLMTCLLVAAVDAVLTLALTALAAIYVELELPAGWVVNIVVSVGALLVTAPFVAAAATLLYLDLRVRSEGLDIELAAARRFPAA